MQRRAFLKSLAAAPVVAAARVARVDAQLPPAKITRVRINEPPTLNRLFNQSNMICTVETDLGITGVGEGGAKDTLEQCAGALIGKDPFRIEANWQEMFSGLFYPPGREKTHAMGALDLALWDIKGKALTLPIHELLGGRTRAHCECYSTGGVRPNVPAGQTVSLGDRARATIDAGFRAFRFTPGDRPVNGEYRTRDAVRRLIEEAKEIRAGVGPSGEWCVDFHQRFDFNDGLRACRAIEAFEPLFVEDPVRDEQALMDLPKLRTMTTVPLTHGEEWGHRWEFNTLVEHHDVDYIRSTLPNVGGITEMMKVAAICETHAVGIVPHFTGPVATAALVNCLSTFSGPVLLEYNMASGYGAQPIDYLPELLEFRDGKMFPNQRPGLGVRLDPSRLKQIGEVTMPGTRNLYERPDGSLTHW